jgi:hypothetical protein
VTVCMSVAKMWLGREGGGGASSETCRSMHAFGLRIALCGLDVHPSERLSGPPVEYMC